MKAKTITYSKTLSTGNFNNVKISLELEVEPGEKASEVFQAAKKFVDARIEIENIPSHKIQECCKILNNPRSHTPIQMEEAQEFIDKMKLIEELPF